MTTPPVVSITDDLLAELEQLAGKATPGPWVQDEEDLTLYICQENDDEKAIATVFPYDIDAEGWWREGQQTAFNYDYIARANPATILALLAHIADLKQQLAAASVDADRYRWLRDKALTVKDVAPAILLVDDSCEPAVNATGWQSAISGADADVSVDAARNIGIGD